MTAGRSRWKVGELAELTGLTVRTLHHYDEVGLVPSERDGAGHRIYGEEQVRLLYQVSALRQVGLSLAAVAEVLGGNVSMTEVLTRHHAELGRRLTELRAARSLIEAALAPAPDVEVDPEVFAELIRTVVRMDEIMSTYFDDQQLAALAERRERIGDDEIARVEAAWPVLIAAVQQAIDDDVDPRSDLGRDLAAQWKELLAGFHGGDEGLERSLFRMSEEQREPIRQQYGGPSQEQIDFITRAG